MFMRETTDLQPRFGITLQQVLMLIEEWDPHLGDHNSRLNELTFCREPTDLLCGNAFAIKVLQQHPEYIHGHQYFYCNDSEEALYLLRNMSEDNRFAAYQFQELLTFSKVATLDTYLSTNIPKWYCSQRYYLYRNPRAIPFVMKHVNFADNDDPSMSEWAGLSENPGALDLLEDNPDKIDYSSLSKNTNPKAMEILRQNPQKIDWRCISENPSDAAVDLLFEQPHRICYWELNRNTNPRVIALFRKKIEYLNWYALSTNPCPESLQLLLEHPEKIHWHGLCKKASTRQQFELIRANLSLVNWDTLCQNPSPFAVDLLAEHPDQIRWWYTLKHQPVFHTITEYDYAGIRDARRELHEEYHAWACHPSMVQKWKDWQLSDLVFAEDQALSISFF